MGDFRSRVYRAVKKIPFGQVRTYAWVAKRAGNPRAARAVGQILKTNPKLFVVPCHRVVRSDGKPGGYALGEKMKRRLIALEKRLLTAKR
jgi:O-6-methylguanine DNA methyltransferase